MQAIKFAACLERNVGVKDLTVGCEKALSCSRVQWMLRCCKSDACRLSPKREEERRQRRAGDRRQHEMRGSDDVDAGVRKQGSREAREEGRKGAGMPADS